MARNQPGARAQKKNTARGRLAGNPVSTSCIVTTMLVQPNDSNILGFLHGGQLLHWVDVTCAMAGQRHSRRSVVTASFDRVHFLHPAKIGQQIIVQASVNAVWATSMEVGAKVEAEDPHTGRRVQTASAYGTFVALDSKNKPVKIPPLILETETDRRRNNEAQERRRVRLSERAARKNRVH